MNVISIADFGAVPDLQMDATPCVMKALEEAKKLDNPMIIFPEGRYDFWPQWASEKFYFVCNNDAGLKRIVFPLLGFSNLIIDGQGSEFIFHGAITPFILDDCSSVTLQNFSVDWNDNLHIQGTVIGSGEGYIDLCIEEKYQYHLEDGYLMMEGEGLNAAVEGFLEMDAETKAPAFGSGDHCGAPWDTKYAFEQLDERCVRVRNSFKVMPKNGNIL